MIVHETVALTETSSSRKIDMDYFAKSKLFGDADDDHADVEAGTSSGAGVSESTDTGVCKTYSTEVCSTADCDPTCHPPQSWFSRLSTTGGESGGEGEEGQLGAGDSNGILGGTASMLRGSMKSMGIGKRDDESALSVGRASALWSQCSL